MMIQNHQHRHRRGFTLLETLVVIAFLAVATGSVMKLHQARLDFDRVALQRLTDQLAIENIAEHLLWVDDEQLPDRTRRLAKESGARVDVEPFESESQTGWHVKITIESAGGPLVHHLWRFEAGT